VFLEELEGLPQEDYVQYTFGSRRHLTWAV
jgi:hypothetical protein